MQFYLKKNYCFAFISFVLIFVFVVCHMTAVNDAAVIIISRSLRV